MLVLAFRGATCLGHRAREGVNPQSTATCGKSAFLEKNMGQLVGLPCILPLQTPTRPQLTTVGYDVVQHYNYTQDCLYPSPRLVTWTSLAWHLIH